MKIAGQTPVIQLEFQANQGHWLAAAIFALPYDLMPNFYVFNIILFLELCPY